MMSRNSIAWAVASALSLLVPASAVAVWPREWWPDALFAVWTAAAAAATVLAVRREERLRSDRAIRRLHRSFLQTLSHQRHDWMNEIQLLYGYLRLGKPDKAIAVVDRIRQQGERESRISRLGIPELAVYLLSFRSSSGVLRLEIEVEEGFGGRGSERYAERLTETAIGLAEVLRARTSQADEPNVLRLAFRADDRGAKLELDYDGRLTDEDGLEETCKRLLNGLRYRAEEERAASGAASRRRYVVDFPWEEWAV